MPVTNGHLLEAITTQTQAVGDLRDELHTHVGICKERCKASAEVRATVFGNGTLGLKSWITWLKVSVVGLAFAVGYLLQAALKID